MEQYISIYLNILNMHTVWSFNWTPGWAKGLVPPMSRHIMPGIASLK